MHNSMQITKNIKKYSVALLGVVLLFNSCKKEYESIESIDEAKIQDYLSKNNISAIKDPSGFYYQILDQGAGEPLLNKDSVFYQTSVKSLTGTVYFSPSPYFAEGTYLGYVNPTAYRTAMHSINRGGKVRLIVPSHMAFGKNGSGNIPPNEVIVSEISVLPEKKLWQVEDNMIQNFITTQALTGFDRKPSRVYVKVTTLGTGALVTPYSTITAKYKGRVLNGTQFDASDSFKTPINELVHGWEKGLVGLPKGSVVRIIFPSDLGYGATPRPSIPANSILDFDIELLEVEE
ncbi:MAG: hypothetical protein EOO90_12265 [Pedobacter sp.]|nr:MAG: hypothetical protein EOO90_12265 [Pedobacter sp.]